MIKRALFLALLIALIPGFALAGNVQRGKEIYDKKCWWCHGEEGFGDGPAAEFLNPPPRDFTAGTYKWKSTPFDEYVPSDEDFAKMIKGDMTHNSITGWTGMNGTSMPGWSDTFSNEEVSDLIAYIKTFSEMEKPEMPPISIPSGSVSQDGMERAKKLFKDRCSECHGQAGRGDATKKLKDDWGYRTWPRDLTKGWSFRVSNDPKDIYTRITVGIPGTQMPSFADPDSKKKLTEEERWEIANYVASLNAPYKKPGDDTVINAKRVEGALPSAVDDPVWEEAEFKSYYLVPQIVAEKRHFKPSLDSISVKALYNANEIALLIEWDDRTKSLPGNAKSIEIADSDVFEDSVAVQWPVTIPAESEKPYFGHGDSSWPVNVWQWKSESGAGMPQTTLLRNAVGIKSMETREAAEAGLTAAGVYDNGTWRVIMKRPLKTDTADKDIQFEEGRFIPVSFAAWDGSNMEKGSKHEMTTWYWVLMQPETGSEVFLWPVIIGIIIFGFEIIWLKSARKSK